MVNKLSQNTYISVYPLNLSSTNESSYYLNPYLYLNFHFLSAFISFPIQQSTTSATFLSTLIHLHIHILLPYPLNTLYPANHSSAFTPGLLSIALEVIPFNNT